MEVKKVREVYELWHGGQAGIPFGKILWEKGIGCHLDKDCLELFRTEILEKITKVMKEIEKTNE